MSLVVPTPDPQRYYQVGSIFFTYRPDSVLSSGIDLVTGGEEEPDGLVATHCGIVLGNNQVIEALDTGMTIGDIGRYVRDPEVLIWCRTLVPGDPANGLKLAWWLADRARMMEGTPYDVLGLGGFLLDHGDPASATWIEAADCLFCSEAVATLLRDCPYLPESTRRLFYETHPSRWAPEHVNRADIWMPGK